MSAQLNIRGNIIELEEQITYNFQVGDIADFSAIKSNYTSSFKIPKTQDVVQLFEGLGIPSDMSRLPYTITGVQCLDDYTIVYEGSLIILRTDSLYYHSTVISGAKVFSDAIAGLTLFDVVGSEITNKTPSNVLAKLRDTGSSPTKYLYADYGGEREISGRNGAIDIDLLAESVSIQFVLDAIFSLAGFSYSLPTALDLTDEYITLPIPPLIEYAGLGLLVVDAVKGTQPPIEINPGDEISGYRNWDSVSLDNVYFNQAGTWNFTCFFPGDYVILFKEIIARASLSMTGDTGWEPMRVRVLVNGNIIGEFTATVNLSENNEVYRTVVGLNTGDVVEVMLRRPTGMLQTQRVRYQVSLIDFNIHPVESQTDKLRDVLDLSLTDFIKEFCYRYALIPIHDGNSINFIGFHDIIDNWNVLDWTDKNIDRTEEGYTLGYGDNNWLRHSYVNDIDAHYDLNVPSGNKNEVADNDIIVSKIFAPNLNRRFETYESEEKNDGEYVTKTHKRYFWISRTTRFTTEELRVASRTVPGYIVSVGGFLNFAEYTAAFSDSERWRSLERIIQGLRVHKIDLHITTVDVSELDITRIYYFEQEQAYYMLNRLAYTKGQVTNAEFVKVNCVWGWEGINPYCTLDNDGFNTGVGGYSDLRNYLTGEEKPNVPSDPDYIAPENKPECDAPVLIPQLASISNESPYTLTIEGGGQKYRVRIIRTVGGGTQIGDTYEGADETHTYNWFNEGFLGVKDVEYYGGRANVTRIEFNGGNLNSVNLSGFTNLTHVQLGTSSTSAVNSALEDLDTGGAQDGYLSYSGTPDSNAALSYNSLLSKGWTIDGNPPS